MPLLSCSVTFAPVNQSQNDAILTWQHMNCLFGLDDFYSEMGDTLGNLLIF